MPLEPYAKFPSSLPVTAKHAKTSGTRRGSLKDPIIPFTQGNRCLLSLHHRGKESPNSVSLSNM